MFSGIIENKGIVKEFKKLKYYRLEIDTDLKFADIKKGSSVSCNGVCLTVTSKKYIVQYEHNDGDSQYRDTYSFNKNDVSQVKTIYEIKEGLNYVIDKYGKYEADCVKEKE